MVKIIESKYYNDKYKADIAPFTEFDKFDFANYPAMPMIYVDGNELPPLIAKIDNSSSKNDSLRMFITIMGNEEGSNDDFGVGVDFIDNYGDIITFDDGNSYEDNDGNLYESGFGYYGIPSLEEAIREARAVYNLAITKGSAAALNYCERSSKFEEV